MNRFLIVSVNHMLHMSMSSPIPIINQWHGDQKRMISKIQFPGTDTGEMTVPITHTSVHEIILAAN